MEYGMNGTLKIHFSDDLQTEILDRIEFIFKQENKNDAAAVKRVTWVNGEEPDSVYTIDDDLTNFFIPFTREETFLFKPGKKFYADARIHYTDVFENPHVPVVAITMDTGLFGRGDEDE